MSPSVSSDTDDMSSSGSSGSWGTTADDAVEPSPIFCRLGGGRSSAMVSSSKSEEEATEERGESGGVPSCLAIVNVRDGTAR